MTVVSIRTPDGPYGLTVNSFTSVSLKPPLVLICLDNQLGGLDRFQEAGAFAVNILSESQEEASIYFSTPGTDRSRWLTEQGAIGLPLLSGALASLECEIVASYPGGDHTILVGEVKSVVCCLDDDPLLFVQGEYR